jgi:hypothetical protein
MLQILCEQEPDHFPGIVTGHESWFFQEYSRNHIWKLADENVPERISQKIKTEKHMLTVFWSTRGPLLQEWLPPGESFDSTSFCDFIMPCLSSAFFLGQTKRRKHQVYLRMDNARPHTSKRSVECVQHNKFERMPHPPYSPDIAPSDFYLFGTVKQRLQTCEGGSFEELEANVHEILAFIKPFELSATMRAWMGRLQNLIDSDGGYQ